MTVRVKEWKGNPFMADYRGSIIADFQESHGGRWRMESSGLEGLKDAIEANARLIAAAPKMFEALERALDSPFEPDKWAQDVRWALEEADGIERHPQPAEKRRDDLRVQRAAPELLEVCKGLLAAIRDRFPGIEKQVETAAGLQSEYHCAVAAIAKAEGR